MVLLSLNPRTLEIVFEKRVYNGSGEKRTRKGKSNFLIDLLNKIPSWIPFPIKVLIVIVLTIVFLLGMIIATAAALSNTAPPFISLYQQLHPTPTPVVCSASGYVYNTDIDYRPIPDVTFGYFSNKDGNHFVNLATTDENGYFEFDCTQINDVSFPFQLVIKITKLPSVSGMTPCTKLETIDEQINKGQVRKNINVYISPDTEIPVC